MSCAFYLIMKYTCCKRCSKEEKRRAKDIEMTQQPQTQHHQQDRKEEKEGCASSGNGEMPMPKF